jgi:hypothetical protein
MVFLSITLPCLLLAAWTNSSIILAVASKLDSEAEAETSTFVEVGDLIHSLGNSNLCLGFGKSRGISAKVSLVSYLILNS